MVGRSNNFLSIVVVAIVLFFLISAAAILAIVALITISGLLWVCYRGIRAICFACLMLYSGELEFAPRAGWRIWKESKSIRQFCSMAWNEDCDRVARIFAK